MRNRFTETMNIFVFVISALTMASFASHAAGHHYDALADMDLPQANIQAETLSDLVPSLEDLGTWAQLANGPTEALFEVNTPAEIAQPQTAAMPLPEKQLLPQVSLSREVRLDRFGYPLNHDTVEH